jgi:hypothetical protein
LFFVAPTSTGTIGDRQHRRRAGPRLEPFRVRSSDPLKKALIISEGYFAETVMMTAS